MTGAKEALVTIAVDHVDIYGNPPQHVYRLMAMSDDGARPLGYIDYSTFGNEVYVDFIYTMRDVRRQGIATAMLDYFVKAYEGWAINWGYRTVLGKALLKRYFGGRTVNC